MAAALVLGSDRLNEANAKVPESHEPPFTQEQKKLRLGNLAFVMHHNSCSTQKWANKFNSVLSLQRHGTHFRCLCLHGVSWSRRVDDHAAIADTVYAPRGYRLMRTHQVHWCTKPGTCTRNKTIHTTKASSPSINVPADIEARIHSAPCASVFCYLSFFFYAPLCETMFIYLQA